MTIYESYRQLLVQLNEIYDEREAANIADLVIEHLTGQRKIDRVTNKELSLTEVQLNRLHHLTGLLLAHKPIQYVLNEAWFAGMKLYVDENVLIPRPETEELVEWVLKDLKNSSSPNILDIGTGSGCIPIALKKKLPKANIKGLDVSEGALNVAIKNAMLQAVQVYFLRMNFLEQSNWTHLGKFDIIVSNPPYVKQSESATMQKNVLENEPHVALFVQDEDALLFYRHIARFGKHHLTDTGMIFLEINEALGKEVTEMFRQENYLTELKKDMQGKDRLMKVIKV